MEDDGSPNSSSEKEYVCAPEDCTVRSYEVWNELPNAIKMDPILAKFKKGYEEHFKGIKPDARPSVLPQEERKNIGSEGNDVSTTNEVVNESDTAPLLGGGPSSGEGPGGEIIFEDEEPPSNPDFQIIVRDSSNTPTSQQIISCPPSPETPKADEIIAVPDEERIVMFDDDVDEEPGKASSPLCRYSKLTILVICWLFLMIILTTKSERNISDMHQISVPEREIRSYWLMRRPYMQQISLEVEGAFLPHYYGNLSKKWMTIWIEMVQTKQSANNSNHNNLDIFYSQRISPEWTIPLVSEKLTDDVPEMRKMNLFNLYEFDSKLASHSMLRFQFKTNLATTFPLSITYDLSPIDPEHGIVYAAFVLLGLYILIIFELVHRTIAAILGAAMSVAILALLNERPTKMEMVSWVDVETLLLLFSMMILVAILAKSGVFDYLAVLAYKFTNGKVWPLVNTLCFFTALISSILDNVTTVLLMTPVTIRLCEVVELNPVPILMAMIMYSNIGGAITPIGDPPNVIIAMNEDIVNAGVDFVTFIMHMSIPLIIVMLCVHVQLRFVFRNICDLGFPEPQDIQELRHEINVWRRAAESLSSYSKDEEIVRISLMKKVRMLLVELKKKLKNKTVAIDKYTANLEELQSKYPIRDGWLLLKSGLALSFVITMFFLHSLPDLNLSLGWAALLGALLLLILSDKEHIESVFARVEWSTLIFFAALFILMEALARLGLIDWIGHQTEWVILQVHPEHQLAVALLLILWVSGIASAFVDNIPLTTMMVKIIIRLSQKEELHLPLQPLVWALALGACLGGNGTLIGASSNVVCAGVAEQHGYRFSFMQFLKLGFPVTVMSLSITSIYLMIFHVWFGWNG